MNLANRQSLVEKIKLQGFPNPQQPLPVVSLEEFFLGNDDPGSIGCNLLDHPGIDYFYQLLGNLRQKSEVQDVLVEIYDLEEEGDAWPFSERVYLLTSASQPQVEEWVAPLQPDEVNEGWMFGLPPAAPALESGMSVFSIWWD